MRMITYLSIGIAVIIVSIILRNIILSKNWRSVEGVIVKSEIQEIYNRPGLLMSENRESFEYKIDLSYRYSINGLELVGQRVYPGLPNIFPDKASAEDIVKKFTKGAVVEVFVDPKNPGNACLISSRSLTGKSLSVMLVIIICIVIFVLVGFYLFEKVWRD